MRAKLREKVNYLKQRLVNQQKDRYGLKKGFFTLSEKNTLRKRFKARRKSLAAYSEAKTFEIPRGRNKVKKLTLILKSKGGRNNTGKITVRHQGGRSKRFYRMINYKHLVEGPARIVKIDYDPNRTGFIALLLFPSGLMTYVLCAEDVKIGQKILISRGVENRKRRLQNLDQIVTKKQFVSFQDFKNVDQTIVDEYNDKGGLRIRQYLGLDAGNILPLRFIPLGSFVFNISKNTNGRAVYGRAAGVYLKLVTKKMQDNGTGYAGLALPSGKIVYVDLDCIATFGRVSNSDHHIRKLTKAGQNRWRGIRPSVRGVAMNPVDHPMGGGEGKTSGGRPSVSAWGRLTKGFKTKKKRYIKKEKFLLRRRNQLLNYKIELRKPLPRTYYYQRGYFQDRPIDYFTNRNIEHFLKIYQRKKASFSSTINKISTKDLHSIFYK
jgi:large subunit ribosomal protein L2